MTAKTHKQPTKVSILYINPYIPWHDPLIIGGKLGEKLTIQADGKCTVQTLISNGSVSKILSEKKEDEIIISPTLAQKYIHKIFAVLTYIGVITQPSTPALNKTTIYFNDGSKILFVNYKEDENKILYKISMAIRNTLNRADLMVFDGNSHDDFIDELEIKFNKDNFQEKIILNRKKETLSYTKKLEKRSISTTYTFENKISNLLGSLNPTDFTTTVPGLPSNAFPDNGSLGHFQCTLTCRVLKPIKISGDYEQFCLPNNWNNLMTLLYELASFEPIGPILDSKYYSRRRRCTDDYIYLTVSFAHWNSDKHYNYLTYDDSIEIGDWILVSVGYENREQEVLVIDKNYYKKDEVPYPLNKIKKVIRKISNGDD